MNTEQWKEYYIGMVKRGIRPHKVSEMIEKCGGKEERTFKEHGKDVKRLETQDEAGDRLIDEIKIKPFKVGRDANRLLEVR